MFTTGFLNANKHYLEIRIVLLVESSSNKQKTFFVTLKFVCFKREGNEATTDFQTELFKVL